MVCWYSVSQLSSFSLRLGSEPVLNQSSSLGDGPSYPCAPLPPAFETPEMGLEPPFMFSFLFFFLFPSTGTLPRASSDRILHAKLVPIHCRGDKNHRRFGDKSRSVKRGNEKTLFSRSTSCIN